MYNKMLYHSANEARGEIVGVTIMVERAIDRYLSNYFCSTDQKRQEFKELMLFSERITLDAKKEIFIAIIKMRQPAYLINNPDFLPLLTKTLPHRNIFAHLDLIHPLQLNGDDKYKLVFKKYINGKLSKREYGLKEFVKVLIDLNSISGHLLNLVEIQEKRKY